MNKHTQSILARIAESYSREKDSAQPRWLETEIQLQVGCTAGRALGYANDIRVTDARKAVQP